MVEVHFPQLGSVAACAVVQKLIDHGYALRDLRAWTFVLEKQA